MPSQIIHVLAGRSALVSSGILDNSIITAAFNLGCQGPDIFSHNRRTKPFALAYSRLLHRQNYGRFCRIIGSILLKRRFPSLESWFYGFVTHQIVDRIFHPYVINRSFVSGSTNIAGISPAHFHAFFERILDVRVLEDVAGLTLGDFDTGEPFKLPESDISELSLWIASALGEAYPDEIPEDSEAQLRVDNAFRDTIYFYEVTNPVLTNMKRSTGCTDIQRYVEWGTGGAALLFPEFQDLSVDWLNSGRKPWQHPVNGEWYTLSVKDLYQKAVDEAVVIHRTVSSFFDGALTPEKLEEAVGNECLSVSGTDGRIGTVRFFDSFDLGSTLLDQVEKRKEWLARALC